MYSLYVVQRDGILSQADVDSGYPMYGNQSAGDHKYVDANGDGVIDPDDRQLPGLLRRRDASGHRQPGDR